MINRRAQDDLTLTDVAQIEARINDIELSLPPAEASIAAERNAVLPQVSGILKEHDRVLEYLEKSSVFSSKASGADDDEQDYMKRMEALTTLLAKYTADTVRTRLDRVYLEALGDSQKGGIQEEASPVEADDVEQEISTLYADIDDLIQMVIQQQHEGPILRAIGALHEHRLSESSRELDLVCDSMDQITQSMINITQRLKARQSYRIALTQLSGRYREDLAYIHQAIEHQGSQALALKRQNLQARRAAGLGILPAPATSTEQQENDGTGLPAAVIALLRQQGIAMPVYSSEESSQELLDDAVASLRSRKEALLKSMETPELLPEAPLLAYLRSADTASQLISDALMADAKFQASLTDEDQEHEFEAFSERTEKLREKLANVDMKALSGKDPAREDFLRRWGSDTQ